MLIFLDIDGVMVPAKGWEKPTLLNDGFFTFSLKATHALNYLISEDTTVILTTSHRFSYSITEWKEIFATRGLQINKLTRLGKNDNYSTRKDEILNWLSTNDIQENYVIIDDDKSLNDLPAALKKNLILTASLVGLTDESIQAIREYTLELV